MASSSHNPIPDLNQPIVIPQEFIRLAHRSDQEATNESMDLCIRATQSVANLAQRLKAKHNEKLILENQVQALKQKLTEVRKKSRLLKKENVSLNELVKTYSENMDLRLRKLERYNDQLQENQKRLLAEIHRISGASSSTSKPYPSKSA